VNKKKKTNERNSHQRTNPNNEKGKMQEITLNLELLKILHENNQVNKNTYSKQPKREKPLSTNNPSTTIPENMQKTPTDSAQKTLRYVKK